jgi:hypothetical protein
MPRPGPATAAGSSVKRRDAFLTVASLVPTAIPAGRLRASGGTTTCHPTSYTCWASAKRWCGLLRRSFRSAASSACAPPVSPVTPARRETAKRLGTGALALRQDKRPSQSDVAEHRREGNHDDRRPADKDRQIIRLPPFESRERSATAQKAEVEHGRPRQIDQENHVHA